jgi:hypothetical protein
MVLLMIASKNEKTAFFICVYCTNVNKCCTALASKRYVYFFTCKDEKKYHKKGFNSVLEYVLVLNYELAYPFLEFDLHVN